MKSELFKSRINKEEMFGVKIDHKTKVEFEQLCHSKDMTVSQALRNLIRLALEASKK